MSAVRNVLVIGAGAAGTAVSSLLADGGISVDLVDVKPDVAALGSGITLMGNALRVLRRLGVWDRVRDQGYGFDTVGLRAPDAAGTLIVEIEDAHTGGPDLPCTLGIYRPSLARILVDRAAEAGVGVRFGTTVSALAQDEQGVKVTFADGARSTYDLVIGADGIRSWTRRALGIEMQPRRTGMGIWRAFTHRPESVTRTDLYYGGSGYLAGYCPTGEDTLYAYIVEDEQDRSGLTGAEGLGVMRELAEAYHGPWDDIRALLDDGSRVNYTRFESHIVESPWNRGRCVLIGDAAHSCPPTLAQGAAMALEDATVLAELLLSHDDLDTVWPVFMSRRFERTRTIVEGSVQVCRHVFEKRYEDIPPLLMSMSDLVTAPA